MKTITLSFLLGGAALAQTTQRVSVGTEPNGPCGYVQTNGPVSVQAQEARGKGPISSDGRFVAFVAGASNLVSGDTNAASDIFVRDHVTGAMERVSVGAGGAQANGKSLSPSISSDGRFVAFVSYADNLVPGDTNQKADVFVRDRLNGVTERVSVATGGVQADGASDQTLGNNFYPPDPTAISADGRFVAFASLATNLAPGSIAGKPGVFVRDRAGATTERVSVSTSGTPANNVCVLPSISSNGRFVTFLSTATNLITGAFHQSIYVHDRQSGTTELASASSGGAEQNNLCQFSSVSDDGWYVAFESTATNVVPGATSGNSEAYLRDRLNGSTILVSAAMSGMQANNGSLDPVISGDGRFVSFSSSASDLVANDTNNAADVFVRDLQLATTERVSVNSLGQQGNGMWPAISSDGRYVTFGSGGSTFVPGTWLYAYDVFVRDRQLGTTQRVSQVSNEANSFGDQPAISADGNSIAFRSGASNIGPQDFNAFIDVYVYDRPSASLEQMSVPTGFLQSNGSSYNPAISSDGLITAFESDATNLVPGDTNNFRDIFARDRLIQQTQRVSVASNGSQASGNSYHAAVSADGRFVAFRSDADNLVPNDTHVSSDVFVRDLVGGTTEIVDVTSSGGLANDYTDFPAISADGRYIAFFSSAENLVANDTNLWPDFFLRDRQSGTTQLVSVATNGTQGNNNCFGRPSISADGRYVAFASNASNLVPGDTNNSMDVFVRDMQTGTTERVSVASDGTQGNDFTYGPTISADGRFVAFESNATNLVPGDTNSAGDVFIHDRLTRTTERLSLSTGGSQANNYCDTPSMSSDGRIIAFQSDASNLVPNDTNGSGDVLVRDRGALPTYSSFCPGDGSVTACPCANNGSANHGCNNSSNTGGATIAASGVASLANDTLLFTTQYEKATALSVVNQGDALVVPPAVFGQGLRCVGGHLKRLYTKSAVNGSISAPSGADPSVHTRSSAAGDPLVAGSVRYYYVYYRDQTVLGGCPVGSTFNTTPSVVATWTP